MNTRSLLLAMSLLLPAAMLPAAETDVPFERFNLEHHIGDKVPAWKELPGTDGRTHSLADLQEKQVVVVVFTCASCPSATDYEARISRLAEKYAGEKSKVAVVPICVNREPEDKLEALTKRVKEQDLKFHYLYDESQRIAKRFGAVYTPEFYVLNKDREIVYLGGMDDATDPAEVEQKYVEAAIAATLKGEQPEVTMTYPRGCLIRYVRERRRE